MRELAFCSGCTNLPPRSLVAMIFWMSCICGRLFDAGYMRWLIAGGTLLTVFSVMMVSLATTYWQIILSQGIALGARILISIGVTSSSRALQASVLASYSFPASPASRIGFASDVQQLMESWPRVAPLAASCVRSFA